MENRWLLFLTATSLLLGACSDGGGAQPPVTPIAPAPATTSLPDVTGQFTYEYKFNGCTTGKHQLSSKKEFCDSLLNDSANNNCAREMRIENYNRMCTNTIATNVDRLPQASTARCVVNGMDLKDRTFLENLNPFNPQRLQSVRDIFWDAKRKQSYGVISMTENYGRVSYQLFPSTADSSAQGQVLIQQQRGDNTFSATSGLGSQVRLVITNYETAKEVESVCRSHASFKRSKADLSRVQCSYQWSEEGRSGRGSQRDEVFNWDQSNAVQKELYRGRAKESIFVRVTPANSSHDAKLEIEILDIDIDKTLKAEAALNEGLAVRYKGHSSGIELAVNCAPASK